LPIAANGQKESILDICCQDQEKSYIIEIQRAGDAHFTKRAQYYAAKVYSNQLTKGLKNYNELKPVVMLTILKKGVFFPKLPYLTFHEFTETSTKHSFLKDLRFVFLELQKFNVVESECVSME
jgi:predicted transposase/invertase (TIGR01784 family)